MAATRYQGRLRKWNVERSYGFILASDSGQDVFVHISAFARDDRVPQEGDELSFEVEPDGKGRKHAVRVQHVVATPPAKATPPRPRPMPSVRPLSRAPQTPSFARKVVVLILLTALGGFGYSQYHKQAAQMRTVEAAPIHATPVVPDQSSTFTCDGRKYCSQMTSCTEAKLFLEHCPGVEMDGDNDGVPCEQQWCN